MRCDLLLINLNIILADLVKGMFKVILDVIETNEDKAVKDRHHIFQVGGEIIEGTGELRSIDNWKNVNKYLTIGS